MACSYRVQIPTGHVNDRLGTLGYPSPGRHNWGTVALFKQA